MECTGWCHPLDASRPATQACRRLDQARRPYVPMTDTTQALTFRAATEADVAFLLELLSGTPVGLLKVVRRPGKWDLVQIQISPAKQGMGLWRRAFSGENLGGGAGPGSARRHAV